MISPNNMTPEMHALLLQLLTTSNVSSSNVSSSAPSSTATVPSQRAARPTRPSQASTQSQPVRVSPPISTTMTTSHASPSIKASTRIITPQIGPISITFDTSTRIMGHCNTIHLPTAPSSSFDPSKVAAMIALALKNHPQSQGRPIEIKVNDGVNICGSKNTIVPGDDSPAKTSTGEAKGGATIVVDGDQKVAEDGVSKGIKRKAEEDPIEMPQVKKTTSSASE